MRGVGRGEVCGSIPVLLSGLVVGAIAGCGAPPATAPAKQDPKADYGDAPDERDTGYANRAVGRFPTSAAHDGARVLHADQAWLGNRASLEHGAMDASDADGQPNLERDLDDGLIEMMLEPAATPPSASLTVRFGQRQTGQTWFLNVLVDLDQSGAWNDSGSAEWLVQNFEIEHAGDAPRNLTQQVTYAHQGKVPARAWMRVALTNRAVPTDWQGQGWFDAGEIEDHLVELASEDAPLLSIDCKNPRASSGLWAFDGARFAQVTCEFAPQGTRNVDALEFDLERKTGGVTHSGVCGDVPVELDEKKQRAHAGPVRLSDKPLKVSCLFNKDWPLPSQWALTVRGQAAPSSPTALGIRLGHNGKVTERFNIGKGQCLQACTSSRQCGGDDTCTDSCCVSPWAAECAGLSAEACGRCCAITGGVNASDCVRQACVQ